MASTSQPEIIVYTNGPGCQPCKATKRKLDKLGLEYDEVDATNELFAAEARGWAKAFDLDTVTPIVLVAPRGGQVTDAWSGFRPDRLDSLTLSVR